MICNEAVEDSHSHGTWSIEIIHGEVSIRRAGRPIDATVEVPLVAHVVFDYVQHSSHLRED